MLGDTNEKTRLTASYKGRFASGNVHLHERTPNAAESTITTHKNTPNKPEKALNTPKKSGETSENTLKTPEVPLNTLENTLNASNKPKSPLNAQPSKKRLDYVKYTGGSDNPFLLKKYAYRITQNIKNSIIGSLKDDPVAKQYIPQNAELAITPEESADPIGDDVHTPVKGIVHRYPDRVLFKPVNVCAVYCRYCFRREKVGPGAEMLTDAQRDTALEYISNHTEIWEVILTGGDPLVLSPKQLGKIIAALNTIDHVRVIRIHTRVPIADPKRVTPALLEALKTDKPIYLVAHINHAQEITRDVRYFITALINQNIMVLSQSVLLKGVNDNPQTLETLFRELITLRIKPYYLHHPDLAPGTSHFRLSIDEGQAILKALQGRVSGICLPTYMLDIPGGHGKVPLTPCYLKELENGTYSVKNYKGESFTYPPKGKYDNG